MALRILLAIPRWDYGRPEQGDSYEVMSFREPLEALGHDVVLHDTLDPRVAADPAAAGRALEAAVDEWDPDVTVFMLADDEVPIDSLRRIRGRTVTVNWFADDAWRFRSWSRHLAPEFDWVVTTSRRAERAYRQVPGVRAIFSLWAYNPGVFHPSGEGVEPFDVAFIGQRYGRRGEIISAVRASGVDIRAWGSGWPRGRLATAELAPTLSAARISLNFSDSSAGPLRRRGMRFRGSDRIDNTVNRVVGTPRQLKARIFEIPACGSLQIVNRAPELGECFAEGSEVVVAEGVEALVRSVRHHLDHPSEREAIATAGLRRARADHTYEQRFGELLTTIGLT